MVDFTQSFDARDWAKAFVDDVKASPSLATDEETMVSWFASAIMRGFDEHARQFPSDPLIHAVAKFDYEVATAGMAAPLTMESVLKLGLAFARPHVDPDGYRNDLRSERGTFTRDPDATEHRPADEWPHGAVEVS